LKRIKDARWNGLSMATIVQRLAQAVELRAAMKVVDVIVDEYVRANALAALTPHLKTTEQFDELIRASETLRLEGPKGFLFYRVAATEVRRGNIERELPWADEQNSLVLKSYILLGCAEGLLPRKAQNRGEHIH